MVDIAARINVRTLHVLKPALPIQIALKAPMVNTAATMSAQTLHVMHAQKTMNAPLVINAAIVNVLTVNAPALLNAQRILNVLVSDHFAFLLDALNVKQMIIALEKEKNASLANAVKVIAH